MTGSGGGAMRWVPDWDQVPDWLGWLVAVLVAIVAIRATFRFDLNQWQRDRRQSKEEYLRMLCPHVRASTVDGKAALASTYVSPSGTTAYQCQLCGAVTYDASQGLENVQFWANNPEELIRRHKKMRRLARKLGRR